MQQLPLLTPESAWRRPTELPDLRNRSYLAVDTETKDDGLAAERGPGWVYGAGYVCGVSWAAEGSAGYAPIRHPDSECFTLEQVTAWLRAHVDAGVRLVFQNAPYDLGWIGHDMGVVLPGEYPVEDALAAAFMIDENQFTYNLDDICARLGIPGKDEKLLTEAGAAYLRPAEARRTWKLTRKVLKTNLWRLPARYVGPYAEADAAQTLQALLKQLPTLAEQGLEEAYRLEMDLVPTVRAMRARGVAVNVDLAARHRDTFRGHRDALLAEMTRRLPGRGVVTMEQLGTNRWLDPVFEAEGIRVPKTAKTEVNSYTKEWMENSEHWLPKMIVKTEAYHMAAEKFFQGYLLDYAHRGRLHSEIHQYKSDSGGTVSYRLSMSDPPLQQAPSPDINAEIGGAFRECFEADVGAHWHAADYSQQEYRLTAHYAARCGVRGGAEAARAYEVDPDLDYHQFVADQSGLTRAKAKIQNFAILYGQGIDATAEQMNASREEAQELRAKIEEKAPFGPALDEFVQRRAQAKGFIVLLDGARCRFDQWECAWISREERSRGYAEKWPMAPCDRAEAEVRRANPRHPWHGVRLRRAFVKKALNRLIQGGAARMTKKAMRAVARAGVPMILQVHDEINSVTASLNDGERVGDIMRTVEPGLLVPMKVDVGTGRTWAEAKGNT